MISRLLMIAALATAAACGNPAGATDPLRADIGETAGGVTLSVDAARYTHGDTIELRLVNSGGASVGYNLCSSVRERETATGWETIEPMRMCTAALYPLAPGTTATSREPVDPEWGSGKYRIATTVYVGESHAPHRVATATFQVTP